MAASQQILHERLLRALAEQLKLPLLQIAHHAELVGDQNPPPGTFMAIQNTASIAIQLIDGYLLSTELSANLTLQLEPITISSVMYDVAHTLEQMAKRYDTILEIDFNGRHNPIMGHRESLESALTVLGYSFIEAQQHGDEHKHTIVLGTHRSPHGGIVSGWFTPRQGLTSDIFRRAQLLYGTSRQPLPSLSSSVGAGIFVADSLFNAMESKLKVAHHHKLAGLAATLLPSHQLQLI